MQEPTNVDMAISGVLAPSTKLKAEGVLGYIFGFKQPDVGVKSKKPNAP